MYMMGIMYHLYIFSVFIFITTVSSDEVDESCLKLFTQEYIEEECCETVFDSEEDMDEKFEDCKADDPDASDEAKCDSMKCYLKSLGIWKEDEFNNEAAKKRLEHMELKHPNNKNMAQRVSKQCLDGKYLNYGKEEVCPAMKYFICDFVNTLLECDSWKKTDQCSKSAEYASKCKALLDSGN